MRSNDIMPDSFTYSTLIKGIKNAKNKNNEGLNKAFDLVYDLIDKNNDPDEILFNCLIDACVRYRNLKRAEEAYKLMIHSKVIPSSVTFGILIKAYGNAGYLERAFEIFENFLVKKGIKPNDVT